MGLKMSFMQAHITALSYTDSSVLIAIVRGYLGPSFIHVSAENAKVTKFYLHWFLFPFRFSIYITHMNLNLFILSR